MEYVNILSIVTDSDRNTTKELMPLINEIPTDYFPDTSMLSNTAIANVTRDGLFVAVSKKDDIVVLKLFSNGEGSLNSCTKKVKIEFIPDLKQKLLLLKPNQPTSNLAHDLQYQQLCMVSTIYSRTPSKSYKHSPFKAMYTVCYYLRKNTNNQFFLQSEIRNFQPETYNNTTFNELSIFNKIKPIFQRELTMSYNKNDFNDIEEFDDIEELKDIYNFDDVDYDEDDLSELMDENEYDNDLENDNFSL